MVGGFKVKLKFKAPGLLPPQAAPAAAEQPRKEKKRKEKKSAKHANDAAASVAAPGGSGDGARDAPLSSQWLPPVHFEELYALPSSAPQQSWEPSPPAQPPKKRRGASGGKDSAKSKKRKKLAQGLPDLGPQPTASSCDIGLMARAMDTFSHDSDMPMFQAPSSGQPVRSERSVGPHAGQAALYPPAVLSKPTIKRESFKIVFKDNRLKALSQVAAPSQVTISQPTEPSPSQSTEEEGVAPEPQLSIRSETPLEETASLHKGRTLNESASTTDLPNKLSDADAVAAAPQIHQMRTPASLPPSGLGRGGRLATQRKSGGPPKKELERIVDKIQKKDTYDVFRDPVTEEMAPGYFTVVKRPMDFQTIRGKISTEQYASWDELEDDLTLMFDNAMLYNGPDSIFHKLAASMKNLASKLVDLGRQGVQSFRGRTAAIMRAHNIAQFHSVATAKDLGDDAEDGGGDFGVAIDFGRSQGKGAKDKDRDLPPVRPGGEDVRVSYKRATSSVANPLGSLQNGASCEGVAYSSARSVLRPVQPLSEEAYCRSVCRFISGLAGDARKYVLDSVNTLAAAVVKHVPIPASGS